MIYGDTGFLWIELLLIVIWRREEVFKQLDYDLEWKISEDS